MLLVATTFTEWFQDLWAQALSIWGSGGWAMYVLALIAFVMFSIGVHVRLRLFRTGFTGMTEATWRAWVENPDEREGPLGRLITHVTKGETIEEVRDEFELAKQMETAPFERELRFMKVCVSAAPLVGLLGTVTGMLSTFDALATGSGGDKTMAQIASGISEALVTTETGLVIALVGVFFQYNLRRGYDMYRAFLAQLETVCVQMIHRTNKMHADLGVQREARIEIARSLQRAVS